MFGPPGSGKGTYASRIKERLQIPHISTGDLVREEIKNSTDLGKNIEDYSRRGELVPDNIITQLLRNRINQPDCADGFILDGFPRTIPQADALDRITHLDVVINLEVPDQVIVERLSTRLTCKKCGAIYNERFLQPKTEGICDNCGGPLIKREDDKPEVIQERLNVYRRQTQPLLDYYKKRELIENISNKEAGAPIEEIVDKIMRAIESKK